MIRLSGFAAKSFAITLTTAKKAGVMEALQFRALRHLCHVRQSDLTSLKGFRGLRSYENYKYHPLCRVGSQIACASTAEARRSQRGPTGGSSGASESKKGARLQEEADAFLADTTYTQLGFHSAVSESLQAAGYARPSTVQALAAGPLLRGSSTVLAAETGSGKTLAYLAPIISCLIEDCGKEKGAEEQAALVLCPNAALCDQVVSFADRLRQRDGGFPLVGACKISSSSPPPPQLPDIVVATPASLINATRDFPEACGWFWSSEGIVARMRWVVVDEADLLLTGGFERDVRKILHSMRAADKAKVSQQICREAGVSFDDFLQLPKGLRQKAREGGAEVLKSLELPARTEIEDRAVMARRQWKRQYCFVAATMPELGDKSVAAGIQQVCPDAVWLSGPQLHRSVHSVCHSWAEVNESSWMPTLQAAVAEHASAEPGANKTLVFVRSVADADSVAEALRQSGLEPLVYHREVAAEDRERILREAAARTSGFLLVCTDAAARGLDIPQVTHVVQADFAASAVDFLHRVGRTGRAGQPGKVTSLYTADTRELAEAIRDAVAEGRSVEGAFSRNRSFRKKVRKYGRYVPRGQQG